jgi:hypothetical protein
VVANPSFHDVIHRVFHNPSVFEGHRMTDTCAVELRVRLPQPLADEVERVKESDPEVLSRIVAYGVTRRAIFDHLMTRGRVEWGGS